MQLSDLIDTEIQTLNNTDIKLTKVLKEFSESPIFKNQIINTKKNISAIIIYLKRDNNYLEIKKIKQNYSNLNNQFSNYKDIEKNTKY